MDIASTRNQVIASASAELLDVRTLPRPAMVGLARTIVGRPDFHDELATLESVLADCEGTVRRLARARRPDVVERREEMRSQRDTIRPVVAELQLVRTRVNAVLRGKGMATWSPAA